MKKSERVFEICADIMFGPLILADRLPRGLPRFIGYFIAIPFAIPACILSFPFAIVVTVLEMWEEANAPNRETPERQAKP